MAEGTVRWFDSEEGHGYIVPDGGGQDVYVSAGEIEMFGYQTLDAGERVTFDVEQTATGPRAVSVTALGEVAAPGFLPPPPAVAGRPQPERSPRELGFAALVLLMGPVCAVVGILLAVRGHQIAGLFFLAAIVLLFLAPRYFDW